VCLLLFTAYSRASTVMLFAIHLWMVGTFIVFWKKHSSYGAVEKQLVDGVAIGVPLLAIRAAYPLIWSITAELFWSSGKYHSIFAYEYVAGDGACWDLIRLISGAPMFVCDARESW